MTKEQDETARALVKAGFELDERGPEGWAGSEELLKELDEIHALPIAERPDAIDDWRYRYLMAWASVTGVDWCKTFSIDTPQEEIQADWDRQPQAYRDASGRVDAYVKGCEQSLDEDALKPLFDALRSGVVGYKKRSDSKLN